MTVQKYLEVVAIAYDSSFKELRRFSPLEKYQRKADGRHGGLLDLPKRDSRTFHRWFHSGQWAGAHPWEIVFGHPHGIMISPHYDKESNQWYYVMWVDSLGWYSTAAKMAIALGENKIPFEFYDADKVIEALKGEDDVEVGPFLGLGSVSYDDIKEIRPDAVGHIIWDPVHQIHPLSGKQKM